MPRVASGTKDEFQGVSGKIEVVADRLTDEVMEATEWRPEAVRVVFTVKSLKKDLDGKEVSWAIPIAQPDLRPFTSLVPQGEAALRMAINGMLDTSPRWANVYNNFIRRWLAPVGKHIGTLDNLRQITRKDGSKRIWFRLITKGGLTSEFPTPWPDIECRKGETADADWMGPAEELNEGKGPFPYLTMLGLDWKKFTDVELEQAPALFPGHYDSDMIPIDSYFADVDDLTPELLKATFPLKSVQWEVIDDDQYGLSVKRGQFFFELTPVVVEGSTEDKAFQDEREVFLELWDNLTKVVLEKPEARLIAGTGKPTEHGKLVIKGVMVPIVRQYPQIVKLVKDGIPTVSFNPVSRENWRTNGLAVLGFVAERLMKSPEVVNLDDPTTLLAWAAENVPELADDMSIDEGEEF